MTKEDATPAEETELRHVLKLLAKDKDMAIVVKDVAILYGKNWVVIANTQEQAEKERDLLYKKYGMES